MRRLLLVIVVACGCGEGLGEGKKEIVPFDKVSPVVLKAAQDKLPEIKFDSALKTSKGLYEVRGKAKNSKIQEVEVNASGEVVAVE
jgi:hypothetical protein